MNQNRENTGLIKMIMILEFILVGYLIYSLTKNSYSTYKVDKYIAQFEEENKKLEAENKQKNEDFLYYISEEYADKIAKQNFGLVNPGEEVIVVATDENYVGDFEDNLEDIEYAKYQGETNASKWKRFIFE